jgi:hypothetical protein
MTAEQVITEKGAESPIRLQFGAERPQRVEVENQMNPAAVQKHVGHELPEAETTPGGGRRQSEIPGDRRIPHQLRHESDAVQQQENPDGLADAGPLTEGAEAAG